MRITKNHPATVSLSLLFAGFCFAPSANAEPGAWPQAPQALQLINTVSYYQTEHYFDNSSKSTRQPAYKKTEWNPYFAYGLNGGTTIGASIFLQAVNDSASSNFGIGDSEFFVTQTIWRNKNWIFSIKPLIKLPSPGSARYTPQIGSRYADAAISGLVGANIDAFGLKTFAELETQYRNRLGPSGDQFNINATFGVRLAPRWMLMPQLFQTVRTGNSKNAAFTQSPRDDYDLTKLQVSTIYTLNRHKRLQLGFFSHIEGRNAGNGSGMLFSVWTDF